MDKYSSSRRDFIKASGISITGWVLLPSWVKSDHIPFIHGYPKHNIPIDKNIDPEWVRSLYSRDKPTTYLKSKNELKYIGMPAGGLHTGTLYIGGDGRLWLWEIYNDDREGITPKSVLWNDGTSERTIRNRDGANYISPAIADNHRLLAQGFAIRINDGERIIIKELREEHWDEVSFEATYPLATISFMSRDIPVKVTLTAGAFFIPLDPDDSSLPATSFHIKIDNRYSNRVEVAVVGWLENGANKVTAKKVKGKRQNAWLKNENYHGIYSSFSATDKAAFCYPDSGTMCFALVNKNGHPNTSANPFSVSDSLFSQRKTSSSIVNGEEKLIGSIATDNYLVDTGGFLELDFIISWHFNHTLKDLQTIMPESKAGYYYATIFKNAAEIIDYIGTNFDRLSSQTRLWQSTYYDSTLPHWFLERCFINIGTIATANTYRFASGRFWGWEGVNACPGTCTHVWQYGHTLARIFPSLEKDTRERVDLDIRIREDGGILFRGEFEKRPAIDGQAGTILRFYREHQMSVDNNFLKQNWTKIKKAISFMFKQDKNNDGMTDTPMENTLDAVWEGEIAWIVGLCIAAAKAGQQMAEEMGDRSFHELCKAYVENGCKNMEAELFNGEYFIHRPDPIQGRKKLGSYNTCHIDQVYGQSWAFQVGLGRLWDKEKSLSALHALWKYNFAPDVGPYIQTHTGGRPYALAGDAGLIMNTNPHNEPNPYGEDVTWQLGYFHECMSGFEHQVAAHMMAEGMTDEALIVTKAIHDRYHGSKRNPYNEIECSDHYARAMASYGTFIASCGFEYHGPKGHIGFAPKVSAENFKAPFTTAQGWGTYSQQYADHSFTALYKIVYGQLKIKTIGIGLAGIQLPIKVLLSLDGQEISCKTVIHGRDLLIKLEHILLLSSSSALKINING